MNNSKILLFVVAADAVRFTDLAVSDHLHKCPRVIIDVEPVPDLLAIPVHGQRLPAHRVHNGEGYEFLGKLVRSIVVGTIRDQGREAECTPPSAHQVITRRLGGGIRTVGRIRGAFCKQGGRTPAKVAVDFVGAHVMKAKPLPPIRGQGIPVGESRLQQRVCTDDVGIDELAGAVDGAIDVRLGGEVHHDVRLVLCEDSVKRVAVYYVGVLERVARIAAHAVQ